MWRVEFVVLVLVLVVAGDDGGNHLMTYGLSLVGEMVAVEELYC